MSDLQARLRLALGPERLSPFCPHLPTVQQRRFLDLADSEAFYGGAAGGGKSDALLMAALQFVHVPEYSALILRRTNKDLILPGAIMDRARTWLTGTAARWSASEQKWTFPSGARLTFGYCQDPGDEERYQSAEFHYIGIDEVTQWLEKPYRFLFSRLRRLVASKVPARMRSAGNPGGIGHRWVKERFVDPKTAIAPFVPAKVQDNPHIDVDEYLKMLGKLEETSRLQLAEGRWVQDTGALVYRYDDERNGVDALPNLTDWHDVLGFDIGASESKPTSAFSHVVWHEHHPTAYVIKAWKRAGLTPSTAATIVGRFVELHPDARVVMDEGALGKGYGNELRTRYQLPVVAAKKTDKRGYRRLFNGELEGEAILGADGVPTGKKPPTIKVLRDPCRELLTEWDDLVLDDDGLDEMPGLANHCADATLYAWREARAFTSTAAPDEKPKPYTDDWFAQQEAASIEQERRAWQREQSDPWETW